MDPAALSPAKAPPASLFASSAHTSHASFPIIAVAVIGILATAILLVSYYIFVIKCCLNWHRIDLLRRFSFSRRRAAEEHPLAAAAYSPPLENRGLTEAAIRSIPIFKFGSETSDDSDDAKSQSQSRDCAVCLNEFQRGEKLRAIPNCSHVFHIDCIDIWLQNNANCPLCRTSISAARPETLLPMDRVFLGPGPAGADRFTGRDEDYVVIEIGSEPRNPSSPPGIHERGASSNELPSPRRKCPDSSSSAKRKKMKKLSHVSSMGDECIDSRRKDEQFVVQPMRRSFSMDSAADSQLYLAVEEIIQRHGHVNNELNQNEGSSSRVKKSFFSFGQGRCSRNAVQPVALEPRS
ncbi:RING-H2 finger protein ATL16-like [Salvia miltiorrhiza]|uniref:RING-H2 finger protein ATL16-like n=1 Tax=Salvia miltiorrhiza TaxID=226208 RepID=UPI0025AC9DF4|nr:RING-H2 finger protein ATL16-like [Salvia miltiorrhiza]